MGYEDGGEWVEKQGHQGGEKFQREQLSFILSSSGWTLS